MDCPKFAVSPLCRALGRAWRWVPWSLLCLGLAGAARAQAVVVLEPSLALQESLPERLRGHTPVVIEGERITGVTDRHTVVEGAAMLRRHDLVLRADRLEHFADEDRAIASGQVRINRMGNRFEGTRLDLQLDSLAGRFDEVRFQFLRTGGQGDASRVDFLDEQRAVAHQVRYSTCERPPGANWLPDWAVTADEVRFDFESDTGEARGARLEFKGVTLLAAPWLSFPLSDARKSGLLPPSLNLDNQSGFETTLPYYLNLAPNRDATLYPTLMSKRGVDLGGEFRYLEPAYAGQLRAAWMPSDQLRDRDRWAYAVQHQQALGSSWGLDSLGLRLNLNRVSDDLYWRDFPRTRTITNLAQRLLANEAVLSGGRGAWSVSLLAQRWQTLGAASSILNTDSERIVAPYDRLPSLALRYTPPAQWTSIGGGLRWQLDLDLTRFHTDRQPRVWDGVASEQRTDLSGTRALAVARLAQRWEGPSYFIEPSVQLHARQYQFERALGNGRERVGLALPTAALDAGLIFERDTELLGRAVQQTLEPRVLLAVTPYREQRWLPVYDSAAYDFNLATIFAPNPYGGNDRIADQRAITYGLTSRLYASADGAELATLGVAQRLRLRDQRVSLPNEAAAVEGRSDLLIGANLNWSRQWSIGGTWQYNTDRRTSVRTVLSTRYQPGAYRVLNLAYRNNETTSTRSRQLDLSWQWPLAALWGESVPAAQPGRALGPGQWYSAGRVNYSFVDRRIIDLVAGFEYDAGCWIARVVLERLQQSSTSANQRIQFQLEFSGFSRLGSNPLQTLRNQVPRYQYLREDLNPPSRFERYD